MERASFSLFAGMYIACILQVAALLQRLITTSQPSATFEQITAASAQPTKQPDRSANGVVTQRGSNLRQLLASHQNDLLEDERKFLTDATALLKVESARLSAPLSASCSAATTLWELHAVGLCFCGAAQPG